MPGKYKFVNGVMVVDGPSAPSAGMASAKVEPLAVVSTPDDLAEATMAAQQNNITMKVPEATISAMGAFEDPAFMAKYRAPASANLDGNQILDEISARFAAYEVPLGMLGKLLELNKYKLNFIIDDSGSMSSGTDSLCGSAGPCMAPHLKAKGRAADSRMTRWEEAEDRLHIMIELLAYVPTEQITIGFLNRADKIVLDHNGKTPAQLAEYAHAQIHAAFSRGPSGSTPTLGKLQNAFGKSSGLTMHYLFTDGVPDEGTAAVSKCVLDRAHPERNPLTFVSCTGEDSEAEWMKEIEEAAPFTGETDDYSDERDEVMHDQGPAFPYTRGLWLMCLLVGAINPDDLDAMDDERPFSRFTMSNILGRALTDQEYKKYWDNHPKGHELAAAYSRLASEMKCTREILGDPKPSAVEKVRKGFGKLFM